MFNEEENINEEEEEEREEEEQEEEEQEEQSEDEQELDDKDIKIKELEEELQKERGKEKNFKNLKDKEKGKRMKIGERVERMEGMLKQEQENRQALQDSIMKDRRLAALDQLAGQDKDLREQLDERVKASEAYLGAPKDSKELTSRYEKAFSFLKGTQRRVNPLHSYSPVTGQQNALGGREKRFTDTQEGKSLMEEKFPKIAALEKKKKK